MRQDDGSELLGANDPRSATIGVIHVAPNDDRQSVLAAILTQDKLGRKQVAVVLPEDNKAFQRPIDFDGLKNMRRGLKAQIVFVASGGPGPAEFARQRRFPVYSSLDSYARALSADGEGSTVIRRGWRLGRRQKPGASELTVPSSPLSPNDIEQEPTHPLPNRSVAPSEQVLTGTDAQVGNEEEQNHGGRNAALLGGAGLAAGLGLGALAAGEHGQAGHGASVPAGDEDWEALPGPTAGNGSSSNNVPMHSNAGPQTPPSPPSTGNGAGPEIIAFPSPRTQGRITGKLPPIPAVVSTPAAQPHPPAIQSGRRRNSGKMAVVGAAGAAAGAGAIMAAGGAGVGTPPPPTQTGGGGGGGASASRRRNRRRLLALALILLTLLLIAGIAFASPGGIVPHIGGTSGATVTITPASTVVNDTYTIDAVPGGKTGTSQVTAQMLTSMKSQSGMVNATGTGVTPATTARGSLTFFNTLGPAKTIAAGTIIPGADGVKVMNDVAAVIPAASPPNDTFVTVAAHAVNAGASGNIAALDVNESCCVANVLVQNQSAFSGGQDAKTFTTVSQNDINGFVNSQTTSLPAAAKADLMDQARKLNEPFVAPVTCSAVSATSTPQVGQPATKVNVTATATCSGEVYDQQTAFMLARDQLMAKASQSLDVHYKLVDDITTTVKQIRVADPKKGIIVLLIFTQGRWVYTFTDTEKMTTLPNLVAGLTKDAAQKKLLMQQGVSAVSIDIPGGGNTLPTDISQIHISVVMIQGFKGTPTPTAGPGTPTGSGGTATSGSPTPTPTPVTGLGGS